MTTIVRQGPSDIDQGTKSVSNTHGKQAPALATQRLQQGVAVSIPSGSDGDRFDKLPPHVAAGR